MPAGFLHKAALTREPLVYARTWPGTAAAATTLLPLLAEDVQAVPEAPPSWAVPHAGLRPGAVRARRVAGTVRLLATYNALETVWAMALGAMAYRIGGTALPETLVSGAYRHLYEVAPALHSQGWPAGCGAVAGTDTLVAGQQQQRRGTLVVDKVTSCWETLSLMIAGLDLEATPAGVTLALGVVGHSLSRASATNADLDALTDPGFVPVALHDVTVRLGVFSTSSALDAGDDVTVTGVRLHLDNVLQAAPDVASGLAIAEPRRLGPVPVTGELLLPAYDDDTLLAWLAADTALMMDWTWTGPAIAATGYTYQLRLSLPCVHLITVEAPTSGAEQTATRATFAAYTPSAAAAGLPTPWHSGPLTVELVTDTNAHPRLEET